MSAPNRYDILLNVGGFGLFALAALAANFLIARTYGPSITGLFNQVLALYIIVSQFAVCGIHLAALREASLIPSGATGEAAALFGSALLTASGTTLGVIMLGLVMTPVLPMLFGTPGLSEAWRLALPGLFAFSLNKVMINVVNGCGRYRFFAFAQAARSILFLAICIVWIAQGRPGEHIALALTLAEFVLSATLLTYFAWHRDIRFPPDWAARGRRLFRFGVNAMPGVALADLNSRIDILVLGLFASPEAIGIYGIAAWLIEGAIQLPVAIRPLVNPRLAKFLSEGRHDELASMVRRVGWLTAAAMALFLAVICMIFPWFVDLILGDSRFQAAKWPLAILSIGVVVASFHLPFDLILSQGGYPLVQSRLKAVVMLTNLVLAILLVPLVGIIGAAIAYSLCLAMYGLWLRILVRRTMGSVL